MTLELAKLRFRLDPIDSSALYLACCVYVRKSNALRKLKRSRKVTRKQKEMHTSMVFTLEQIANLVPSKNPLDVVRELCPGELVE